MEQLEQLLPVVVINLRRDGFGPTWFGVKTLDSFSFERLYRIPYSLVTASQRGGELLWSLSPCTGQHYLAAFDGKAMG